jgi:hypothetical protein
MKEKKFGIALIVPRAFDRTLNRTKIDRIYKMISEIYDVDPSQPISAVIENISRRSTPHPPGADDRWIIYYTLDGCAFDLSEIKSWFGPESQFVDIKQLGF